MNKNEVIDVIKDVLNKVLDIPKSEVHSASKLEEDLKAGSEKLNKILAQLERELSIEVPDSAETEIADATVGQLADYLMEVKKQHRL